MLATFVVLFHSRHIGWPLHLSLHSVLPVRPVSEFPLLRIPVVYTSMAEVGFHPRHSSRNVGLSSGPQSLAGSVFLVVCFVDLPTERYWFLVGIWLILEEFLHSPE